MTSFAVIASWHGRSPAAGEAQALLEPVRHRCTDGVASVVAPGAAAAVGLRAVVEGEVVQQGLLVDRHHRRLFAGDVRLYDRDSLIRRFGRDSAGETDLELVARAFQLFGQDVGQHLVGDFAVVVWEWETRTLFAVRDHFGLRPLHYRILPDGIALASDVRQLLALEPSDYELDAQTVFDYLLFRHAHHGRTFFRAIKQVWPAHAARATADGLRQHRYWVLPVASSTSLTSADAIEEWRHLFETAVGDRLRSTFPVGAYLSGGLDSGSIVGAAHRIYEADAGSRPPLFTFSALFPGMDCDESGYIDEVLGSAPLFTPFRWNGLEPNQVDFDAPVLARPGLGEGMGRGPRSEIPAMKERGVRVALAGTGGDELGWSHGVFRQLIMTGRLLALGRELNAYGSLTAAWRALRANLRGFRLRPLSEDELDWPGPALRAILPRGPDDDVPGRDRSSSRNQWETWRAVQLPSAAIPTDGSVLLLAEAGIELRLPYRDVRLVEAVIRAPLELKLPHGDMRGFQRRAASPYLAQKVLQRRDKSHGNDGVAHQIRVNLPRVREVIEGQRWETGTLVNQRVARRWLRFLRSTDPGIRQLMQWNLLWKMAVLETWSRRLGEL